MGQATLKGAQGYEMLCSAIAMRQKKDRAQDPPPARHTTLRGSPAHLWCTAC